MTALAEAVRRKRLARHESGHAAAALVLGRDIDRIEITDRGGQVHLSPYETTPEHDREDLLILLSGALCEGRPCWPPSWIELTLDVEADQDVSSDVAWLRKRIDRLGLDETDWDRIVLEARQLIARSDFNRIELALKTALAHAPVLDTETVRRITRIARRKDTPMQHMTREAKASVLTDRGEVRLLASTYELDRGGDVVQRGAFSASIERWQTSGKRLPLHWDHQGDPESIIGTADPATMRETAAGLVIEATLDLEESARAREVWRLVKSDSLGVSFGYMAESTEGPDGTRLLTKVDLFEISLTPAPMNPGAKVLAWKSVDHMDPRLVAEAMAIQRAFDRAREVVETAHEVKAAETQAPIQVARFDA